LHIIKSNELGYPQDLLDCDNNNDNVPCLKSRNHAPRNYFSSTTKVSTGVSTDLFENYPWPWTMNMKPKPSSFAQSMVPHQKVTTGLGWLVCSVDDQPTSHHHEVRYKKLLSYRAPLEWLLDLMTMNRPKTPFHFTFYLLEAYCDIMIHIALLC
jgi:hypothetical protein